MKNGVNKKTIYRHRINGCELCLLKNKHGLSVIKRASPKCKLELRKALRFFGQYEFTGNTVVKSESLEGIKVFEVIDFGTDELPIKNGRVVHLKYYEQLHAYAREVSHFTNIVIFLDSKLS